MSERLPGDMYAKLNSRDSGVSCVWDRWCRSLVGRPSSMQMGADALGKGGVRGDAARETAALRTEACGEEPIGDAWSRPAGPSERPNQKRGFKFGFRYCLLARGLNPGKGRRKKRGAWSPKFSCHFVSLRFVSLGTAADFDSECCLSLNSTENQIATNKWLAPSSHSSCSSSRQLAPLLQSARTARAPAAMAAAQPQTSALRA